MPYPHAYIKLTEEERQRISRELQTMAQRGQHRRRKRLACVSQHIEEKRNEEDYIKTINCKIYII